MIMKDKFIKTDYNNYMILGEISISLRLKTILKMVKYIYICR